jgi:uncharacterized membrane protein
MSEPGVPPTPYTPPPPPPAGPSGPAVSQNRQLMIVLSYLWILALIPFLTEKEDREVQWHARHGLVLTAAEFVFWIAYTILQVVLDRIIGGLGCIAGLLGPLIFLGFLVLRVLCIVKGTSGQRFIIPVISQYADRF